MTGELARWNKYGIAVLCPILERIAQFPRLYKKLDDFCVGHRWVSVVPRMVPERTLGLPVAPINSRHSRAQARFYDPLRR